MADDFSFGMDNQQLADAPLNFREGMLDDKTVLVSGGGSGIGKACAWLFARLGAKVVVTGRTREKVENVANAINTKAGLNADFRELNIRDPELVTETLASIWDENGGFDIQINSAGGKFPMPAIDFSPNGWKAVVDTNLNGSFYMMQAAARLWQQHQRPGSIVNMVTVTDRGMPHMAHTAAARAGVIHLSKSVAVEWAPLNIRVNCIAPGVIATEGMHVYPDEARENFDESNAMRRFGTPWEMAEAAVYLGASTASFVTGQTLTVDGGSNLWGDLWPLGRPDYFKVR